MLRKMKTDIWYTEHDISKRTHKNKILPIVIPYNKIGTELARSWKSIIYQGHLFDNDSRLITAFCNGKNIYQKFVHSSLSASGESSDNNTVCRTVGLRNKLKTKVGSIRCNNIKCK